MNLNKGQLDDLRHANVQLTVFQKRFGDSVSLEQELHNLTGEFPIWARPFWKVLLAFFMPSIHRIELERKLRDIDQQAHSVQEQWTNYDRAQAVSAAVRETQYSNPEAHVKPISIADSSMDAVYIEHPPEPGNKAQELLGFSSIEIKAPFHLP